MDLPEYRCIVFQQNRSKENGPDEMDERFADLKKFIDKRTKELCLKHEKIGQELDKVFTT